LAVGGRAGSDRLRLYAIRWPRRWEVRAQGKPESRSGQVQRHIKAAVTC